MKTDQLFETYFLAFQTLLAIKAVHHIRNNTQTAVTNMTKKPLVEKQNYLT